MAASAANRGEFAKESEAWPCKAVRPKCGSASTVSLALKPDKVSLQVHAFQKGRNGKQLKLLALDADANVPVRARLRPQAWQEATFAVKANVGPLAFQHLAVPGDAFGSLRGQLQARLAATGSIPHPEISLDVDAHDVKTDAAPMGDAQLRVRYEADVPEYLSMKMKLASMPTCIPRYLSVHRPAPPPKRSFWPRMPACPS